MDNTQFMRKRAPFENVRKKLGTCFKSLSATLHSLPRLNQFGGSALSSRTNMIYFSFACGLWTNATTQVILMCPFDP